MLPWTAVLTFLKSPLFKYLAIVLLLAGAEYWVYSKGQDSIQVKWDKEKIEVAAEIKALKDKAAVVTVKVETVYVDRVKEVKIKGDTVTKYVDRYITAEEDKKCTIPNNFLLLIDSAALNIAPPEVVK